jgi:hypothetical protein
MKYLFRSFATAVLVLPLLAGPYPPAAGQPGSDAIVASDTRFITWATVALVERGPTEIGFSGSALASYGSESDATGLADASPDSPFPVVSLGDGGSATLEFSQPFGDVPGPDFAVFENGFSASFLELAHVEVSSDGANFFRFPSFSLTASGGNIGEGGSVDPTNVQNLAGKFLAGFGTPFDLAQLRNASPQLDLQRITHVRVIDVVGTNDPALGSADARGNLIIDPYPTPYFSSGFDLDAVGAFSATATTFPAWKTAQGIQGNQAAADSNQNGLADLVEYLTGTGAIQLSRSGGEIRIEFPRLAYRSGGNLRVEYSTDLVHWSALATSTDGGPVTSDQQDVLVAESGVALKWVTLTRPLAAGPGYYRLAAGLAPTP